MVDLTARGRFVWHELITPNGAGAHEFYGNTVGWKKQAWEHDPSYSMFVAPRGPLGAAVERRNAVPQWLAYIGVIDVDAAVAAAARLGAKVVTPPTEVPNAGRHAVLTDPQGATFAVHSDPRPASPETAPETGEFSWHELATTADPTHAFPFYAELFGWDELVRHDMGAMGTYLIFGRNGRQLGGIFDKGAMGRPGPAYWVCYVNVPDLDRALDQAKAARGSVLHGPQDVPGGDRIAQLMDPHGAFFALHSTPGAPAAAPAPKPRVAKAAPAPAPKPAPTPAPKAAATAPAKPKAPARKKAAKKTARRPAKKAAKKTASKAAKKPAKKAAGKVARKTAKKAAKKSAKKSGGKRAPARRKKAAGRKRR